MFDKLRKAKDEGGRMKDEKIHPFALHPSSFIRIDEVYELPLRRRVNPVNSPFENNHDAFSQRKVLCEGWLLFEQFKVSISTKR